MNQKIPPTKYTNVTDLDDQITRDSTSDEIRTLDICSLRPSLYELSPCAKYFPTAASTVFPPGPIRKQVLGGWIR